MKNNTSWIKKITIKSIFVLVLTGITLSYIVSAYNSQKPSKTYIEKEDVSSRLKKSMIYTIGNGNQSTPIADIPKLNAGSSIVSDLQSNRTIYEKNAYTKLPMASTTKIMTFIIAVENCEDIYETVTISREAANTGGSTMHLAEGETITVHDLLYGLLLNSGNDAAVALSEHIGGTVAVFCNMMNKKATELGAFDTNFVTPHGLDKEEHYTTSYDLSLIAAEAYKQPLFRKIIATSAITLNGHALKNTNPLLEKYSCVTGGKTGYTSNAGRCIVFFIESDSIQAVAVLLNCSSSNNRINDSKKLIEYTTKNYETYTVLEQGKRIDLFSVEKGLADHVYGIVEKDICITLADWEKKEINITYTKATNKLTAPVKYSETLGKIYIECGQNAVVDVVAEHSVLRKTYTNHLNDVIKALPYVFD